MLSMSMTNQSPSTPPGAEWRPSPNPGEEHCVWIWSGPEYDRGEVYEDNGQYWPIVYGKAFLRACDSLAEAKRRVEQRWARYGREG